MVSAKAKRWAIIIGLLSNDSVIIDPFCLIIFKWSQLFQESNIKSTIARIFLYHLLRTIWFEAMTDNSDWEQEFVWKLHRQDTIDIIPGEKTTFVTMEKNWHNIEGMEVYIALMHWWSKITHTHTHNRGMNPWPDTAFSVLKAKHDTEVSCLSSKLGSSSMPL